MSFRRLPATVVALGVTSLLTDAASDMIFPLLPQFVLLLGGSAAYLGLIEGMAEATASLLKLGSGFAADRVSRKRPLVLLGYGIAALVRPLLSLATAPWHVLSVRVTDRIGKGIRTSPRDVMIASAVRREDAGRAFGFHRGMDHAGAVVGPLLGTLLLSAGLSVRQVFAAALVPGLLSVASVLFAREPARVLPAAAIGGSASATPAAKPGVRLPAPLRGYLLILALFSLGNASDAFLLLRARQLGVAVAALPLLWAALHVSKALSSYFGGELSDRVPRVALIVSGWAVYAATYLGFSQASSAWQIWLLFVIYGLYYGLTEPCEKALIKDLTPPAVQGRAYGYYNFVIGAAAIPAGVITGWLWQRQSAPAALMFGAVLAALAALALLSFWPRMRAAVDG